MSRNQKIGVVFGIIILMAAFWFLYVRMNDRNDFASTEDSPQSSAVKTVPTKSVKETVPVTPDATVDAIMKESTENEEQILQKEADGEKAAAIESAAEINSLNQSYDASQQ